MSINPGDIVRVSTDPAFTDEDGDATDPDTVIVRWRVGRNGTETRWVYGTDAEVIRDDEGIYHADIEVNERGLYYYRWEGTGAVHAAEESTFKSSGYFTADIEGS